ncbi:MAG: S-layer homology domain-containing protein [Clostridia bacterium]|nr:S-layer homology domain-containing protein [Clostridia bacterium]
MKKFISIILVLVIFSANFTLAAFADESGGVNVTATEFGDSVASYNIPDGATMDSLKGTNGFSDYTGSISVSGNKLLFSSTNMTQTAGAEYMFLASRVKLAGKILFEITVIIDKTGKDTGNQQVSNLFRLKDAVSGLWTNWLQITRNGRIYCNNNYSSNDGAVCQITEATDTKITAIADLSNDTVDLYVNDVPIEEGISVTLPDSVSEWRIAEKFRYGYTVSADDTIENYYSDIKVCPAIPLINSTSFEGSEITNVQGFPGNFGLVPADVTKISVLFSEDIDASFLTKEFIKLEKLEGLTGEKSEVQSAFDMQAGKLEITPLQFLPNSEYILTLSKDIASLSGVKISYKDNIDKVMSFKIDFPPSLKALMDAQNQNELLSAIEQYKTDLGVNTDNFNTVMTEDEKTLFAERLFVEKEKLVTVAEVQRLYLTHELLILSKGDFSLLLTETNSELFGIDADVINNMNDNAKSCALEKLDAEVFSSAEDVLKKYEEICTVSIVSNALNYSEIKSALFDTFKHQFILDTTYYDKLDIPNDVFKAMLKSDYNSIDEIENSFKLESKKCFDSLKKSNRHKSNSGGGGSGGGGSSIILTDIVKPTPPETPSEPVPVPDSDNSKTEFMDLGSALWARDAINALKQKNIVSFPSDALFRPMDKITRAEFVALVIRAIGMSQVQSTGRFTDVPVTHWSSGYIETAFNEGIINGTSESTFSPDAPVTREDIAVILHRSCVHFGINQSQGSQMSFADAQSISNYAAQAVAELSGMGVINGTGEGNFEAKRSATRAEAAKMIYEIILLA